MTERTFSHKFGRIILILLSSWFLIPSGIIYGILLILYEAYTYDWERGELDT